MKILLPLLLLAALAAPASARQRHSAKASAPTPTPAALLSSEIDGADMVFLKTTAESQAAQIALAQFVQARAQEPEVRAVAAALYEQGKKEREALSQLSVQKGLPVSATLSAREDLQPIAKSLSKLKGPKFDKAAMAMISKLENERAATFQTGAASKDAQIRAFAEAHAPAVQESLLLIAKLTGTAPGAIKEAPAAAAGKPNTP